MKYLEDFSKRTQQAINNYYNSSRSWVYATETVSLQKTLSNRILSTKTGTVRGLSERLEVEYSVICVLLEGLKHMGRVELHTDMGFCYRVVR